MRICFVAYFNGKDNEWDMGTRSVAKNLADEVSKKHEVMRIDIRKIGSWKMGRDFKPHIIHFVLAPTTPGFIAAKIFSMYCHGAKKVMSAPNPTLSCRWLIPHLRPDIILTQALESEKAFQELGFQTSFLPNGADINRFIPKPKNMKEKLREKYQIDKEKFAILHVGPIIRRRNIERLMELQIKDVQLIIVGRKKPCDSGLLTQLKERGAVVMTEYIENIEDIYALSDCYVFPTDPKNIGNSIEMPLSVMEAMACNLPVISTKFGALPRVFGKTCNNMFFEKMEELKEKTDMIKNGTARIKTREVIKQLSWENIGQRLEQIYCE